jgi:hypothetical protein
MKSYLKAKVAAPVYKTDINESRDPLRWPRVTPLPVEDDTNFVYQPRPLCIVRLWTKSYRVYFLFITYVWGANIVCIDVKIFGTSSVPM